MTRGGTAIHYALLCKRISLFDLMPASLGALGVFFILSICFYCFTCG